LRSRRYSGFKFRRQMPLGKYVVDFVCLDRRVIVELNGAQRNERESKVIRWPPRGLAARRKFEVLRFWNNDGGSHQAYVAKAAVEAPPRPLTPAPFPRGERGEVERRREA